MTMLEVRNNIADAKARFSLLIRKALASEDIVITKDNRPLVKIVPVKRAVPRRPPGSAKGRVWMSKDFGAPLADLADYR